MTAPLSFHGVTKRYGARTVLDALDLEVADGETLGLVGINGAGKSTLLKALLDLSAIDAGSISICGVDHRRTQAREPLAYLAENFQPPHFATGRDYLRFVARLHRVNPTPARLDHECALIELNPRMLDEPVRQYSKGMRQKLGLIGALLADCSLLILDEPMSGLDPKARALFKARLGAAKTAGATIFFSTHMLDDVGAVCDRIAVLDDGRIRYAGPVAAFAEAYPAASLETSFLHCLSEAGAA
ncbi:MAG: ABC transporter ATP-binding protein [Gammaproteobacteria bacterium]|jgi:ABC-2 type transport system ATP-binding protein